MLRSCRPLPSVETLKSLLEYNSKTGQFLWKERPGNAKFNSQFAGKPALTARRDGYFCGEINDVLYQAHRVAWKIHYEEEPPNQIDHKNGDRGNNAIRNLRAATNQQNATNRKPFSKTSSGKLGVSKDQRSGKWRAYITIDGRQVFLGYFTNKKKAIAARREAEREHNFLSAPKVRTARMKPKAKVIASGDEAKHLARVAAMPCVVTGRSPIVIHHIMKCPGKVRRRDHRFIVPLIPELHNMGNESVHLLGSEARFLEVHGIDLCREAERLWQESCNTAM